MRVAVAATAVALLVGGCSAGSGAPHAARSTPSVSFTLTPTSGANVLGATTTPPPCGRGGSASDYRRVIWIWMENRSYSQILGPNGDAPRLASYGRRCAVATSYYAVTHPSLPNYLAAVSGSTGGVRSDCSPTACPQRRPTIFRQLSTRHRQWRTYAESMRTTCDRSSYGRYAARHNPAVYFPGIRSTCRKWDVAMGGVDGHFATALAKNRLLPFTFIAPNLCSDGHDCATATADRWLGRWLDRIVASPSYADGHTLVFVTWDEGLVGSTNRIATVAVGPTVTRGTRAKARFTHYSLLRTTEEILKLPLLGAAADARSMLGML